MVCGLGSIYAFLNGLGYALIRYTNMFTFNYVKGDFNLYATFVACVNVISVGYIVGFNVGYKFRGIILVGNGTYFFWDIDGDTTRRVGYIDFFTLYGIGKRTVNSVG